MFEEQTSGYSIPPYFSSPQSIYLSEHNAHRSVDAAYHSLSPTPEQHTPFYSYDQQWSPIAQQPQLFSSPSESFTQLSQIESDHIALPFDSRPSTLTVDNAFHQHGLSESPVIRSLASSEEPELCISLSDIASTTFFGQDLVSQADQTPSLIFDVQRTTTTRSLRSVTRKNSTRSQQSVCENSEEPDEVVPGTRKRRHTAKAHQDRSGPGRSKRQVLSQDVTESESAGSEYPEDDYIDSAEEDDSSDAYVPSESSRSPKAASRRSITYADRDSDYDEADQEMDRTPSAHRGRRRGKKSHISGAKALQALEDANRSASPLFDHPSPLAQIDTTSIENGPETGSVGGSVRGRRSAAFPVAIPNLMKKSRGRKVPVTVPSTQSYADVGPGAGPSAFDDHSYALSGSPASMSTGDPLALQMLADVGVAKTVEGTGTALAMNIGSGRGQVKIVTGGIKKPSGERRYVCTADGCGKCFVRGEHLKRHVRSLHTWEKRMFFFWFLAYFAFIEIGLSTRLPIQGMWKVVQPTRQSCSACQGSHVRFKSAFFVVSTRSTVISAYVSPILSTLYVFYRIHQAQLSIPAIHPHPSCTASIIYICTIISDTYPTPHFYSTVVSFL